MNENIVIGSQLLEIITSALYENPIILFREYVQNSLDAYNKAVKESEKPSLPDFKVDIHIYKEQRRVVIQDNGYAIEGNELFRQRMTNIADSDKADRTQYIGFRGIGRLSALPYCKTLTFINKAAGSRVEDVCTWEGEKYQQILKSLTFQEAVAMILTFSEGQTVAEEEHYFKVVIDGYTMEIDDTIEDQGFEQKLRKLLPIRYSNQFTAAQKITERYAEFMHEDLNDFMCSVYLDGTELCKNYTDAHYVLESGIQFWEIRGKSGGKGHPGDKMGILWFTFNRKITSLGDDSDYGILVRSKNVLMGGNDTFADLCQSSKEHVSTYRELTQMLRGVYGELLINTLLLKDNARREWFRTDEHSINLKYIVIEFMGRLHEYRYAASAYYRESAGHDAAKLKDRLKNAFMGLVDVKTSAINLSDFYRDEAEDTEDGGDSATSTNKDGYQYADEDVPRLTATRKKSYDELMVVIREFFEKEQMYDVFLKLRAYIKKRFQRS